MGIVAHFTNGVQDNLVLRAADAAESLLTESIGKEHLTKRADLQGRRLVVASETERDNRLKAGLVSIEAPPSSSEYFATSVSLDHEAQYVGTPMLKYDPDGLNPHFTQTPRLYDLYLSLCNLREDFWKQVFPDAALERLAAKLSCHSPRFVLRNEQHARCPRIIGPDEPVGAVKAFAMDRGIPVDVALLELCKAGGLLAEPECNSLKIALGQPPAQICPLAPPQDYIFQLRDETWAIRYERESCARKDTTGLARIHRLVKDPGVGVAPLLLARLEAGRPLPEEQSGQPVLDREAIRDLVGKREELKSELDSAKEQGRSTEAWAEKLQRIELELVKSMGKGGKSRNLGPEAIPKRARRAMNKSLTRAIDDLKNDMPRLTEHLKRSIKRDGDFTYDPPRPVPPWIL